MQTYQEFWPFYLREHSNPKNRNIHFMGTALTLVVLIAALVAQNYFFLLGIPLCGYGFAWYGHFVVQKNKPATFKHPFWSLYSDYRMFFLWLFRRLEPHLLAADVK